MYKFVFFACLCVLCVCVCVLRVFFRLFVNYLKSFNSLSFKRTGISVCGFRKGFKSISVGILGKISSIRAALICLIFSIKDLLIQ